MWVYLQNTRTGLFYAGSNHWVKNQTEALEFEHSLSARQFCEASGMHDVQVILDRKLGFHREMADCVNN